MNSSGAAAGELDPLALGPDQQRLFAFKNRYHGLQANIAPEPRAARQLGFLIAARLFEEFTQLAKPLLVLALLLFIRPRGQAARPRGSLYFGK